MASAPMVKLGKLTELELVSYSNRPRIKNDTDGHQWISCITDNKKAVILAPTVVLSYTPRDDLIRELPKLNKDIVVLPLNTVRYPTRDITNHANTLECVPNVPKDLFNTCILDQVKDLTKNIWMLIPSRGIDETFYNSLTHLIRIRNIVEQNASLPKRSFPLYCLIAGSNLRQRKRDLNRRCEAAKDTYIVTLDKTAPNDVAEFLHEHAINRISKIVQVLRTADADSTLCMKLMMTFLHEMNDDVPNQDVSVYKKKAYKALVELFDDHSSQVRVQLQQLFDIPNVRVDQENSSQDDYVVVLELRPLKAAKMDSFTAAYQNDAIIQQHLIVNRAAFLGSIRIEIEGATKVKSFLLIQQVGDGPQDPMIARNREMQLKRTIIFNFYDECLKDSTRTPYDFLKMLDSHGVRHLLSEVQNDGYNAMHLAILHQREDFLEMLLYNNEWGYLRQQPVSSANTSSKHVGFTPRRLAESMAYKSKGHETMRAYDHYEAIWMNVSPLSKTVISGRLDLVRIVSVAQPHLLRYRDINDADSLMYACGAGHCEIVRYLLEQKVSTRTHNKQKEACIHIAAKYGHTSVLEELLKFTFDIFGQTNKDGYTAVDICARNGDMKSLELYHRKSFPLSGSCMGIAVKFKQHTITKFLVDICNIDVNKGSDKNGQLPIHHTIMIGDLGTLDILLQHSVDLTKKDKFHKTVLHLAAEGDQKDMMQKIIQRLNDQGRLPEVINQKDAFTGRNLLYMVRGKDHGRRAWHWIKLVRIYIHAFFEALKSGQIDVASHGTILCSGFGSSPDEQTNRQMEEKQTNALKPDNLAWDMTPLHHAANKTNLPIAELLIQHGADIDSTDHFGNTPVHLAAMRGSLPMMVMFSTYGADMLARTQDNKTPMDIAEANGHMEINNYLQGKEDVARAQKFIQEAIGTVRQQLSETELRSRREQGHNLKRHLIHTLRELSISVNEALLDLGSGPVAEATPDSGPSQLI